MTRHRNIIALVLGASALVACGNDGQTDITAPAPTTQVLFFNEALGSPGVNFFADTTKLTATLTSAGTVSPTGTAFNQVAAGGYYTGIAAGQYTLAARLSDTTAANANTLVSSVPMTLADGMAYSYYQSGVYNTGTKTADAFVVQDPIPATYDYTVANVRLVNAIYNANPGTLTITNADTSIHPTPPPVVVGSAVAYKTAGAYVAVPAGSYSVSVTGLRGTPVTRGSVSLAGGRYYTITARGDATVTTGTNVPTLDLQPNR